jgi:prepilin-type N-terminal cleavage/methylation domain-containing protein
MTAPLHHGESRHRSLIDGRLIAFRGGFTLVELVVVLTILAFMAAAAVPTFRSLKDEQVAREPMQRLMTLAKEARLHAIREKRPYQIAFTEKSISVTRYLSPYLQLADLDKFIQTAQVSEDADAATRAANPDAPVGDPNAPPPPNANAFANGAPATSGSSASAATTAQQPQPVHPFKEWTDTYTMPEGVTYTVQNWYEVNPTQIAGDTVKLWVFQPSGMCMPLTVHMERSSATLEASFNALTADVVKDSSSLK